MKHTTLDEANKFEKYTHRAAEIDNRLEELSMKKELSEDEKQERERLIKERNEINKWYRDTAAY